MRRSYTRRIGDVIGEFVQAYDFKQRLKEEEALEYWYNLLGNGMNQYCKSAHISNGTLYAVISSSVARAELLAIREELRIKINEKMGADIIIKIMLR
jgi:hypothetical protein